MARPPGVLREPARRSHYDEATRPSVTATWSGQLTDPNLDPTPEQLSRARERLLRQVRATGSLTPATVAAPLLARPLFVGALRELVALRESDPGALTSLGALIERLEDLRSTATTTADRAALHRAVARAGYRRSHSLAIVAAASGAWAEPAGAADRYRGHASAAGALAVLGAESNATLRDRTYAAGHLHDLGRLALGHLPERPPVERAQEAVLAEAAGRAASEGLAFPAWLAEAALPCGLLPSADDGLEATVGAACRVAGEAGFAASAPPPDRSSADFARRIDDLQRALESAGGPAWLAAQVDRALLASTHGMLAALDAR